MHHIEMPAIVLLPFGRDVSPMGMDAWSWRFCDDVGWISQTRRTCLYHTKTFRFAKGCNFFAKPFAVSDQGA